MALDRQSVIEAALDLVDRVGLDRVTLRGLAAQLEVQAPTLYWHIRNKAELLDALGDSVMDEALRAIDDAPGSDWQKWLLGAAIGLRKTMLAHPDGARIVSGARSSLRRADLSERAMATLVGAGVPLQRARLTVLAVERFTVGYVLEEQSAAPIDDRSPHDPAELVRRLPIVTRAITEYFESGRTADDLFQDGVRLIVGMTP